MNRILGTVVAIAGVLAFSSLASAAPYSFNVSGTGRSVLVSTFSPTACPGGQPATTCFVSPFSAGSSINLDIDGAGVATITSGNLEIDTVISLFGGTAVITTDVTATISGGLGLLSGDDILWSAPADYTIAGTLVCQGSNCAALSLPPGVTLPVSVLNAIGGTAPVNPVILGTWDLDAGLTSILGSSRAVTSTVIASGARASWVIFGANDMGNTVPEPGSAVLVLLGLGALALRSRKA